MIIGLAGYARVGKDTVADHLEGLGFQRMAFADKLRQLVERINPSILHHYGPSMMDYKRTTYVEMLELYGYESAKGFPEFRQVLVDFGAGCRQVLGESVWVNAVQRELAHARNENIVITDVRYANELQMIYDLPLGTCWKIERPDTGPANAEEHRSFGLADAVGYDRVLTNDGTIEDLLRQADPWRTA